MSYQNARSVIRLLLLAVFTFLNVRAAATSLPTDRIESATGLKGALTGDVFRVTSPRNDVPVLVDGWKVPPFMGLTSWAAFEPAKMAGTMVMGDFVLFPDEVSAAMKAALTHGLEVTALHNHFFFDDPHVYFMHIGGEGDAATLAGGVRALLDAVKAVRATSPQPQKTFGLGDLPAENRITAAEVERILGAKVQTNSGMVKATIGRTVAMGMDGTAADADMGVNTWAAFAGTDDNAVVDGDFAATAAEMQAVLKSLTSSGINVVAIHTHMADETPHLFFMHYWGRGKAADLATSLKKALAIQGK